MVLSMTCVMKFGLKWNEGRKILEVKDFLFILLKTHIYVTINYELYKRYLANQRILVEESSDVKGICLLEVVAISISLHLKIPAHFHKQTKKRMQDEKKFPQLN